MNNLFLVLEPTFLGINYGAYNHDNEVVYEDFCPISEWSPKRVKQEFQDHLLAKLRGHGKVFVAVGIVVPFAPAEYTKPQLATKALYQQFTRSPSREQCLLPAWQTWQNSATAWPHLPHYFLFDTYMSADLARTTVLPPFNYDTNKKLGVHPYVLHSYGHRANIMKVKSTAPTVSLYIGSQISVALFAEGKLKDAVVTYSPFSSITGWYGSGAIDPGFAADVAETHKGRNLTTLLGYSAGLLPTVEGVYDVDTLLALAGIIPKRGRVDTDKFSIETLEWMELAVRSFLRGIRQAVGAMLVHELEPSALVCNSAMIPHSSPFWRVLLQGALSHAKTSYSSTTLIQAAAEDLTQTL